MTTPERLRRRQYIEGVFLVILGVFTVTMSLYFQNEDNRQRACLASTVSELTSTLEARADISGREFDAIRAVITEALSAESDRELLAAKVRYFEAVDAVDRQRRQNPIPPFPEGTCE